MRIATWALGLTVALSLPAADPPRWGAALGSSLPLSEDLRITTSGMLNPALGARGEWGFAPGQTLRGRLDLAWFGEGRQVTSSSGPAQDLRTTVSHMGLGAEYLLSPAFLDDRWRFGGGIGLVRWSVKSWHRQELPAGVFLTTGTSTWTRLGLSAVVDYRFTRNLQAELRLLASSYGYEGQSADTATFSLIWMF